MLNNCSKELEEDNCNWYIFGIFLDLACYSRFFFVKAKNPIGDKGLLFHLPDGSNCDFCNRIRECASPLSILIRGTVYDWL